VIYNTHAESKHVVSSDQDDESMNEFNDVIYATFHGSVRGLKIQNIGTLDGEVTKDDVIKVLASLTKREMDIRHMMFLKKVQFYKSKITHKSSKVYFCVVREKWFELGVKTSQQDRSGDAIKNEILSASYIRSSCIVPFI
jgi:hypothetical protein